MAKQNKKTTQKKIVSTVKKPISPIKRALLILAGLAIFMTLLYKGMLLYTERHPTLSVDPEKQKFENVAANLDNLRNDLIKSTPLLKNLSNVKKFCRTSYAGFNSEKRCYVNISLELPDASNHQFDNIEEILKNELTTNQNLNVNVYPATIKFGLENNAWVNKLSFIDRSAPQLSCRKDLRLLEITNQPEKKYLSLILECEKQVDKYIYPGQ